MILLLGAAGIIGRAIAWDYLKFNPKAKLILADRDETNLRAMQKSLGNRASAIPVDLLNHASLVTALEKCSIVINSTNHHFNLPVMQAALEAGCHYLDLGGLFHFTRRQLKLHAEFKRKGLIAILGMGCAPGVSNLMARELTHNWSHVHTVQIKVAGVDLAPPSSQVVLPYSWRTLFEEFSLKPAVFSKGHWTFSKPFAGKELLAFPTPVGKQKIFYTLHSEVATLPVFFRDRGIKKVTFQIGLSDDLRNLVLTGDPSKVQVSSSPKSHTHPDDVEITLAHASGKCAGKAVTRQMSFISKSTGPWRAGDLNTACPASIVAQLIETGVIRDPGVHAPESVVPFQPLSDALTKRGLSFII
ncbi:MAG: saccharopine dehydrogenase NADP-binding domain-containing protein [Verrucomicrobiota bacterium]|nr:saccharopine dehydrogenase NADP-binding domain-containing protein [Verrucomicrobiota bacterium]